MNRARALQLPAAALAVVLLSTAAPASAGSVTREQDIARGTMEDPVYVRELAEGRYLDGELESAVRLYFEVARLTEDTDERSSALVNAAWLEFLLGNEGQALTAMRSALRVHPDLDFDARLFNRSFEKVYLRARVLAVRETATAPASTASVQRVAPATDAEAVYHQARALLEGGDAEGALEQLQRAAALTYSSDSPELRLRRTALLRIGLLYYQRNQWADAATAFDEAVTLDRTDVSAWKNLGLARSKQGDHVAAIEAFQEAYTRQPGTLENARNLAQELVQLERWDDAVSWISDAVRHHDRDAHLRLLLAKAQKGRGLVARAVESWQAAMEIDDSFDWEHGRQAALWLGLAQFEGGHFPEAVSVAQVALEHDSRDAAFWNLLGLAQQAEGNAASARDSFEQACDHDDQRAEYRNNLGRAYAAVGDLPQAEREFVYALTLEPDLPAAQSNLAQVRKLLAQ